MGGRAQSIWETYDYLTKKGKGQRKECIERKEERECGDVVKATKVRSGIMMTKAE
jgi:hypothetical protein